MTLSSTWASFVLSHRPGTIELIVTLSVQLLAFWLPASLYLLLDLLFPSFSQRQKIQSEQRQPSPTEMKECVGHVFRNTLSGAILHFGILALSGFRHSVFTITPAIPPLKTFLLDFAYALIARETLFYYSHRAFHLPFLYKRFHKLHHRFTAPMAFSAQYAHPVEHLFANTLPILLPLALRRANILCFAAFLAYELVETASVHSGYKFVRWPPMMMSPATMHDAHHEKFGVNFGSIGLMDWLHGTGAGRDTRSAGVVEQRPRGSEGKAKIKVQ